jgi:hypothetical protein
MKKIFPLIFLVVLIVSCEQKSEQEYRPTNLLGDTDNGVSEYAPAFDLEMQIEAERTPKTDGEIKNHKVDKKKIIKDGRMGMDVKELEKTKLYIDSLLMVFDAYYANESLQNSVYSSTYNLIIRIPSINFDAFIASIESGNGEITYKDISARDVTDEFIDLETRLLNKRNYLKRYNDILKKANSIREILEVEERIRRLEEEIESTTGRLKYLIDLVDYSSLNLSISKPIDFKYEPDNRDSFFERFKQSFSNGWFGFVDFLLWIIRIWPIWIVFSMVFFLLAKYRRKMRRKKQLKN